MKIEQEIIDKLRGKKLTEKEVIEILKESIFWKTIVEPTLKK